MNSLLLLGIVICTCYGESTWSAQSEAKVGEAITVSWEVPTVLTESGGEAPAEITGWKLFRQTSNTGSEVEVASGSAEVRNFVTEMPTGTIGGKVRFVIRPMKGEDMGPAGAEIVVKRIK